MSVDAERDRPALLTYRYLRIAIVGGIVLLGISVMIERNEVDCWQTSLSAYYYTPVRAVFIGVLMVIGFALIVIKGRTSGIDLSLNLAGMLAPLVALVPTVNVGACWSIEPTPRPVEPDGSFAPWVVANIDNNVVALLTIGLIGLVAAAVLSLWMRARDVLVRARTLWGFAATATFIASWWLAFAWWDDFDIRAHALAAVLTFVCLFVAVALNWWHVRDVEGKRVFAVAYLVIAGLMIVAPVLVLGGWAHEILVLEIIEITLFAVFWMVQTVELWGEVGGERDTLSPL